MGSTEDSIKNSLKNNDTGVKPKEKSKEATKATSTAPSKTSTPVTIASGGARPRHDSTSSVDSARSPSSDRLKRRRTASVSTSPLSSFFFPSMRGASPSPQQSHSPLSSSPHTFATSTSPHTTMSLDEVMSAVNGVTNMALAHEIALDSNFKLEKFEPPQASLEKQVRDVMHRAFWDNLREQLNEDPPVYTQAFVLLQEVRDQLLEITLPHQDKLRNEISEKLDFDLIKQQAEHGVLNFAEYSGYVVSLMAKLCAPVRDDAIQKLREEKDVVSVFCGVAETLDLMKLDMANYTIQMIRPTIMRQIVDYEKDKFKQFLKTQSDGLELTRSWILKHVDKAIEEYNQSEKATSSAALSTTASPSTISSPSLLLDPLSLRNFCNKVLNSAFMELLQWPETAVLPETLCVDSERVLELRDRLHQVCLLSSVILVALSTLVQNCPALNSMQDQLRTRLKADIGPILDPAYTQNETLSAVPNLIEQVIASLQSFLSEHGKSSLDISVISALRTQLNDLKDSNHRITTLVTQRIISFFCQILGNPGQRVSLPSMFLILQEEVARIWSSFLRLTQHNRAVFGEYYFEMTEKRISSRSIEDKSEEQDNGEKKKDVKWDDLDLD